MTQKAFKIDSLRRDGHSSPLRMYRDTVLGQNSWVRLILFEFLAGMAGICPGLFGIALRRIFYPLFLGSVGKGVIFGRNITIRHPHKISVGSGTIIDDNCLLDAKGSGNMGISIGSGVFIGRNSILSCKDGDIIIEDRVNIGFNSEIFSSNKVQIGQDTLIAAYSYLVGGGDYDTTVSGIPISQQPVFDRIKQIQVGPGCWIGTHAVVLNGTSIGAGAIIAAGAVVNHDVNPLEIVAGIPARVLRKREQKAPA